MTETMAKTSRQIQGDIYRLLRESSLYMQTGGEVYRSGLRPRDSRQEDIVVAFTAGIPDQVQTGVVTVNIYVPDIDPYDNGVWVEDAERTEQIELLAQQWADGLMSGSYGYDFSLRQTISTYEEADTRQHFVSVRIGYRITELNE